MKKKYRLIWYWITLIAGLTVVAVTIFATLKLIFHF